MRAPPVLHKYILEAHALAGSAGACSGPKLRVKDRPRAGWAVGHGVFSCDGVLKCPTLPGGGSGDVSDPLRVPRPHAALASGEPASMGGRRGDARIPALGGVTIVAPRR